MILLTLLLIASITEAVKQPTALKLFRELRQYIEGEAEKRLLKAYGFTLRPQLSYFGAKTLRRCLTGRKTTTLLISRCIKKAITEAELLRAIKDNIKQQKQFQYHRSRLTIRRQKRHSSLLDADFLRPKRNFFSDGHADHPKVFGQLFDEIKRLMQQTGLLERSTKNVIKRDQDSRHLSVTRFLSPSVASIFPKDNTNSYEYSQLSPSLLSFYESKEDRASIPSILKNIGMKKYEADAVTDLIAELVGAREILDDVLKRLKDLQKSGTLQRFAKIKHSKVLRAALSKSSNKGNLKQLLEFRRRITENDSKVEKIWQRLNPQIKSRQKDDLRKNGFFFLSLEQLRTIYADNENPESGEEEFGHPRNKRKAFHHSIDNMTVLELLEYLATDPINYVMDTAFQQTILRPSIFGFTILKPTIVGPAVLSPSIFSPQILSIEFLSPGILSPFIGNVDILTLSILSGDILSPNILSPPILQLSVLDFNVLSPSLFS